MDVLTVNKPQYPIFAIVYCIILHHSICVHNIAAWLAVIQSISEHNLLSVTREDSEQFIFMQTLVRLNIIIHVYHFHSNNKGKNLLL